MVVRNGVDFSRVPEEYISNVLSLTSPADVCRAAMVSPVFRSAGASDAVWEHFIPSDIDEILSRSMDRIEYSSKRELYFRLCTPILINHGKMSFYLEKSNGKKCYMLSARQLFIAWVNTSGFWSWISSVDEARFSVYRFSVVAEALNVSWLEIRGRLDTKQLSQHTKYAAYLVFALTEEAHGLDYSSQMASVKVGSRAHVSSRITGLKTTEVVSRHDGWMEIELGEFDTESGDDGEVEFSFMDVQGGHSKSGLLVQVSNTRPRSHRLRSENRRRERERGGGDGGFQ